MVKINILTKIDHNLFERQFDWQKFSIKYKFQENSKENIEWDMVVVFEDVLDLTYIKCKKGGLIFISGEPPEIVKYSRKFLEQFDYILTAHEIKGVNSSIYCEQFYNDWHFGFNKSNNSHFYTFNEIKNLTKPNKTKNISIITSSLATTGNHLRRLNLINNLKKYFGDEIDYFGRGYNFIQDKKDALLDYRFHICIENTATKNLWTEKIADPFLSYTVPIYSGCTNITDYFDRESLYLLNIENNIESINVIKKILEKPEEIYLKKIENIVKSRNLIIDQYNIYPRIVYLYETRVKKDEVIEFIVKPNAKFKYQKTLSILLNIKRKIYKIIYLIIIKNYKNNS